MHRRLFAIAVVAVWFTTVGNASAQDITFRFTGSVQDLYGSPFADISIGTAIQGCYTFNADTPPDPNNMSMPNVRYYRHTQAPAGVVIQIGSHAFQTNRAAPDFWIGVGDDHYVNGDFYGFTSYNNLLSGGLLVGGIGWSIEDPTMQAISSVALPTSPPNLSAWQQQPWALGIDGPQSEWGIRDGHLDYAGHRRHMRSG